MKHLVLIIIFIISPSFLQSQLENASGTDFWVSFMPNAHVDNGDSDEVKKQRDSLFLFFNSTRPDNNVIIDYYDHRGREYSDTIYIDNQDDYFTWGVSYWDFEPHRFIGNGTTRWGNGIDQVNRASLMGINIRSDFPIFVIAHNQAKWSSDACLTFPKKSLGTEYYCHSYKGFRTTSGSRSSQVCVLATEDDTEILISPTDVLKGPDNSDPVNVTLQQGEIYMIQAVATFGVNGDLSGTKVESNKPIAVFSGNERAMVPYNSNLSKDHLFSQMLPVEKCGNTHMIFPFATNSEVSNFSDIYRVVAFNDNTKVFEDDQLVATIDQGETYEAQFSSAKIIKTSATSSVTQIKQSAESSDEFGDPVNILIPPVDQYVNSYRMFNFQRYEPGFNDLMMPIKDSVYVDHYYSILARETTIPSLRFNDQPLSDTLTWTRVGFSEWMYTIQKVEKGVHELKAEETFVCYTYGYGYANSYGLIAGNMNTKILDHKTPEILDITSSCYQANLETQEVDLDDTGIDRLVFDVRNNITLNSIVTQDSIQNFNFEFELMNIYQDGNADVRVYDEFGHFSEAEIEIPGFTISNENTNNIIDVVIDDPGVLTGKLIPLSYVLENYGGFAQDVNFSFNSLEFIVDTDNVQIEPSETYDLDVFFIGIEANIIYRDTLFVSDGCSRKPLIAFAIRTWTDEGDPRISEATIIDCDRREFRIAAEDNSNLDFGIESYQINSENILYQIDSSFYPYSIFFDIEVDDVYSDARFELTVTDSAGNQTIQEMIYPGFTLRINGNEPDEFRFDIGDVVRRSSKCDSILLENVGDYTLNLDHESLLVGEFFSIPTSQLPISLASGESTYLYYCYDPLSIDQVDSDEFVLKFNDCLDTKFIFEGESIDVSGIGESRCNLNLLVNASENIEGSIVERIYPNPSSTNSNLVIGIDKDSKIKIDLYSSNGLHKLEFLNSDLIKGFYELNLDVSDIENGVYFIHILIDNKSFTRKLIIEK